MSDNDPRDYRSLGDLLRDARQERKLSFEQVNDATKISARVLMALEKDDLEGASGPVYARGFVRTLANFYDLDPEWLDAKLDQLAGETSRPVLPVDGDDGVIAGPIKDPEVEEAASTGPKWEVESTRVRHVGAGGSGKVPKNLVYGLVAVLVVAIVLVVWLSKAGERSGPGEARNSASTGELVSGSDEDPAPARPAVRQAPNEDPPGADDARPSRGGVEDQADEVRVGSVPSDSLVQDAVADQPTEIVVEDTPASPIDLGPPSEPERDRESPTSVPVQSREEIVEVSEETPAEPGGLPSVLRPAEGRTSVRMTLRVVAEALVEVTLSADGSRGEVRTLDAGEVWTIEGTDHFSLAVSDPASIRLDMDGRTRAAPAGWTGEEWLLYPPRAEDGDR
jgi:transcriptional regulator with XRE-family HTH domain